MLIPYETGWISRLAWMMPVRYSSFLAARVMCRRFLDRSRPRGIHGPGDARRHNRYAVSRPIARDRRTQHHPTNIPRLSHILPVPTERHYPNQHHFHASYHHSDERFARYGYRDDFKSRELPMHCLARRNAHDIYCTRYGQRGGRTNHADDENVAAAA